MNTMVEKTLDAKEISLIARRYFEEIFNTKYLYFEAVKVSLDKSLVEWSVEVEVQPLYSAEKKRYLLEIDKEGEVKNVEQVSSSKT